MKNIYDSIKEDIRNHSAVTSSVLGMVSEWKRSQFVILSEMVSDYLANSPLLTGDRKFELGTTISHITLQRFFENEYHEKTHNDLRFLRTLDKICIFLGHNDLNNYIHANRNVEVTLDTAPTEDFEQDLITNFCKAQFEALKFLPEINTENITQFTFKDSPLYDRILYFFKEQRSKNLKCITKNNRSNFEIFKIMMVSDNPDLKVLETQEFWNLLFKNPETGERYLTNRLNSQTYFIKKINGEWKIWDNYNPDYGLITKQE